MTKKPFIYPDRMAFQHRKIEDLLGEKKPLNQAQRVIKKFGNARRLTKLLALVGHKCDPATVYKWTYARTGISGRGGTGGVIPAHVWPSLLKAAAIDGVELTNEDMDIRPR